MADTYTLISSVTVGAGGAAYMEFTGIPQTYTDLCLVLSTRSNGASTSTLVVQANGSATSHNVKWILGDGGSASSSSQTNSSAWFSGYENWTAQTSNTFTSTQLYIPNYTGSTQKSVSIDGVTENNGTTAYAALVAGLFTNTAAITQLVAVPTVGGFVQYSTAYLYGIKNS